MVRVGTEIVVDASGCSADALRDVTKLRGLLETIVVRCELTVVGEGLWHVFPGEGGITGMYLLTESHLSIHTYPEHGIVTLNLYCCRSRRAYPWEAELTRVLGASSVTVRTLERGAG